MPVGCDDWQIAWLGCRWPVALSGVGARGPVCPQVRGKTLISLGATCLLLLAIDRSTATATSYQVAGI